RGEPFGLKGALRLISTSREKPKKQRQSPPASVEVLDSDDDEVTELQSPPPVSLVCHASPITPSKWHIPSCHAEIRINGVNDLADGTETIRHTIHQRRRKARLTGIPGTGAPGHRRLHGSPAQAG